MNVEILKVGSIESNTIFKNGKTFDGVSITIKFDDEDSPKGYSIMNGVFTVVIENDVRYVDFTTTRFKELGIINVN